MVEKERGACAGCPEESGSDSGFLQKQDAGGSLALPAGTVLGERYEIGAVLGTGGFGITYKVRDRKNGMIRAMKEFVPEGMAKRRRDGLTLEALEGKRREYEIGLERFTTERQILRKLKDHPGVVDILDAFGANGTEYFLMEYLKGQTFGKMLKTADRRALGEQITGVVTEAGRIMGEIHRSRKILHRDLSPENIYLQEGPWRVRLIDFGSAEWMGTGKRSHFSMVLKRGFAPPEQYSTNMPQGSYTDVYALAGTYYYALTGILVPSALDRSKGAVYTPLKDMGVGIGERASQAVDQALQMDFRLRTQTMEEFLEGIRQEGPAGRAVFTAVLRERSGPDSLLSQNRWAKPSQKKPASAQGGNSGQTSGLPFHSAHSRSRLEQGGVSQAQPSPYFSLQIKGEKPSLWMLRPGEEFRIGRVGKECGLVIQRPEISKLHCILYYDLRERLFFIKDKSTNGVFLENGTGGFWRLQKDRWYRLEPGKAALLATIDCKIKVGING